MLRPLAVQVIQEEPGKTMVNRAERFIRNARIHDFHDVEE